MMTLARLFTVVLRHLTRLLPEGAAALVLNLALLVVSLAYSPSCHLATLATVLPIDGQRENLIQRLRRWLASPHVDWERYYRPLIVAFFADWTGAEVALVMDRTDLNDRFSLLFVGLAVQHRVILLAWRVLPYGGTAHAVQIALLEQIHPLVPDPQRVRTTFFGDAEFRAVELQTWCRDHHWQWQVGVKSDTRFHAGDGVWRPLRSIPVQAGDRQFHQGLILTEQHAFGPVNLIIDWNPNEDAPRYWVLDQPADRHAWRRGRKRFWIEPTNRDLKRAGFGLEDSALTEASRLHTLVLAMAVAFLWMLHLGQWVITSGRRTTLEAAHKRDYSLFRLGRDWVQRALVFGHPIPVGWTVQVGLCAHPPIPGSSPSGRQRRRRAPRVVQNHAPTAPASPPATPAVPQPPQRA